MVTQNMLCICEVKHDFSETNFKFTTPLDLNKSLKQIEITKFTPHAPISELLSDMSSIGHFVTVILYLYETEPRNL